LYGYKDDYRYNLGELSFQGSNKEWDYRASYSYTEDVMFPYLMMDEREIGVYSGFVSLKENKLYFNYTDHIMDNGLRNGMSSMITDANNLTIGLSGNFYEVYYRNWNADNEINTPMMKIENHLMPDVRQYSIKFHKNLNLDKFTVSGKIGLIHNKIGDSQRLSFYQQLYSDAENDRWSGILGLGVGFTEALSKDLAIGALAEFASDVPQIEYLYVSVKKPMNKPYWSGNPKLSNPKKTTLRGKVNYRHFDFEVFSTRVWDYVNLTKSTINNQNFVTYENVESQMMGFNLRVNWQYVNVNAAYTWAKNVTNDSPLTEIPPFSLITTINSPSFKGFQAFIKHTYNDAQVRVDDNQDELHSPSWHSFNSGIAYLLNSLRFSVEIDNLFNEQYYRHLSYMRNPFSSGNQIYEPGRLVRINVTYN
ncbi:MAG: hypothetical protein GY855_16460, partial [candidate division Zixibacteria bacterium]|nr:hypothetical protein [candidate division Zixibacteria bacterium]